MNAKFHFTSQSIGLRFGLHLLAFPVFFLFAACETIPTPPPPQTAGVPVQTLQSGDVLKISFPGSPNLDTTQQIRRDGKINLNLAGEVVAVDKTPTELEKEIIQKLAPQVVSRQINITVVSSSFAVFVNGAVNKPGKVTPDHALTALEAVMEAGGFDEDKANKKAVQVLRTENGVTTRYVVDLKAVLDGKSDKPFYMKNLDILYVPERFSWF